MTRDEVIAMAREAGIDELSGWRDSGKAESYYEAWPEQLEHFAALVAAAEREACALVCDTAYYQHIGPECGQVRYGIAACAAAIRSRSTK